MSRRARPRSSIATRGSRWSWSACGTRQRAPRRTSAWVNHARATMRPHLSGEAVQNYADPALAGWKQAYYGANLDTPDEGQASGRPRRTSSTTRRASRSTSDVSHGCVATAADARRDGSRLGARLPGHDGRDRGAAEYRGRSRPRSRGSAMGPARIFLGPLGALPADGAPRGPARSASTFIVGVALFAVASMVCALATSEAWLVTGRVSARGRWRCPDHHQPCVAPGGLGGGGGACDRALDLADEHCDRRRPCSRRCPGRALSWRWIFLAQRAAGARRDRARARGEDGRRDGRGRVDDRSARLAACCGRARRALVRAGRARPAGSRRGCAEHRRRARAARALALDGVRSSDPLVPPRLLRWPGLLAANTVTLILYAALAAHLLLFPVFLQFLGFSAVVAGLSFTLPSLALVVLAPRAGTLADRIGPRGPILAGCVVDRRFALLLADRRRVVGLALGRRRPGRSSPSD